MYIIYDMYDMIWYDMIWYDMYVGYYHHWNVLKPAMAWTSQGALSGQDLKGRGSASGDPEQSPTDQVLNDLLNLSAGP